MAREITLTLEEKTIQRIESAAENLGKSNGEVVEEAMADYHRLPEKLTDAERQRRLAALDEMMRTPSPKTAEDVRREIEEVRAARHGGGRRTPAE
jgi:hypothetical protein